MSDILFGIAAIFFGIYMIWSTSKQPPVESAFSSIPFKGYLEEIGFITIGVIMIVKKMLE